jgi:hypothetical protein
MVPPITTVTALPAVLRIERNSGPVLVEVLPMLATLIAHFRLLRTIRARLFPLLVGGMLLLLGSVLLSSIGALILLLGILDGWQRLGLKSRLRGQVGLPQLLRGPLLRLGSRPLALFILGLVFLLTISSRQACCLDCDPEKQG